MGRAADRYVDRLLRGRRGEPFTPTDDELAEIRTAVELAGARADDAEPRAAFVAALRDRLAAAQAGTDAAAAPAARAPRPLLPGGGRVPARRRVLQACAVAASGFAAGFATDQVVRPDAPEGARQAAGAELIAAHGAWHPVVAAADLPEGAVRDFDLGGVVGFVHRDGGRVRAVSGICTHQACRLTLDDSRASLVCPCHGATFAPSGRPLHNFRSSTPLPPLPRLPVREAGGRIEVWGPAQPPRPV